MKTTVVLTRRGVISLPAKVRTALGLKGDDLLLLETTPDGILLRPVAMLPVEIYTEDRIGEFDNEEARLESVLPKSKAALKGRRKA